jgi:hypothetical protein
MTNQPSSRQKPCLKAKELIVALLETESSPDAKLTEENIQTLAPLEQDFLQHHLAACDACRAYQVTMARLTDSLRDFATDAVAVPDGLADRIMARLDFGVASQAMATNTENITATIPGAQDDARRQRTTWASWKIAAPVAAAALLLALGIPTLYHALQTGASTPPSGTHTPEIARTVQTVMPSGVSQANQNKQARQTKAHQNKAAQKEGAPVASGAVVASIPANNPPAKAMTSHASAASGTTGLIASASRPPVRVKTVSTRYAASESQSIDGQEIAYDPVESVFGSGWSAGESTAVPASGNSATTAQSRTSTTTTLAALPSGVSRATSAASDNQASGDVSASNDASSDDYDPVSNLVGF